MPIDPVDLTARLVRCPSVTPEDAGAIPLLEETLATAGFETFRADRGGISNLVARWGPKGHPHTLGFNGHTDVVPPGDAGAWAHDPFGGTVRDGALWGRGSADMKSGVAAFVAAASDLVGEAPPDGAIVITVTGDEEGENVDGTPAILDWMRENGETVAACIVGEPTCPTTMGELIKIGRRGALTAFFTATGVQGHAAYPHKARNPLPALCRLMDRLASARIDEGTEHFDPTTVAVVSVETGNSAVNVIPAAARATVNVRFTDTHSSDTISAWLREEAAKVSGETGIGIEIATRVSGESFLTPPGEFTDLVVRAVTEVTGVTPVLSTSGGTSDARFMKALCPVVEFGLVGDTMHQTDEHVLVEHIHELKAVYRRILEMWFAEAPSGS
jgi:succinyl-diaminopimelate desuccinylase